MKLPHKIVFKAILCFIDVAVEKKEMADHLSEIYNIDILIAHLLEPKNFLLVKIYILKIELVRLIRQVYYFNPAIDIVKTPKMIYNSTSEVTKQITLEVM